MKNSIHISTMIMSIIFSGINGMQPESALSESKSPPPQTKITMQEPHTKAESMPHDPADQYIALCPSPVREEWLAGYLQYGTIFNLLQGGSAREQLIKKRCDRFKKMHVYPERIITITLSDGSEQECNVFGKVTFEQEYLVPLNEYGSPKTLHGAVITNNNNAVNQLLHDPLVVKKINEPDEYGDTPLHYAMCCQNPWIMCLLMHVGANCRIAGADGVTPFDLLDASGQQQIQEMENARSRTIQEAEKAGMFNAMKTLIDTLREENDGLKAKLADCFCSEKRSKKSKEDHGNE